MTNEVVSQQGGALQLPGEWAGKLAQYAQETQQAETVAGQFFSTKSGVLSFGGTPIPNNTCNVVVVGAMFENVYYPEAFDANKVRAPLCYAYSADGGGMAPHERVADPQSEDCPSCPMNQWGSAANSKGKACKNLRRLALLPAGSLKSGADIMAATIGYLRVPVTSVKIWSAYAQRIATNGLPPFAVISKLSLVPDPKSMFRLTWDFVQAVTDAEALQALHARFMAEKVTIGFPYPDREPEEAQAAAPTPASAKPAVQSKF